MTGYIPEAMQYFDPSPTPPHPLSQTNIELTEEAVDSLVSGKFLKQAIPPQVVHDFFTDVCVTRSVDTAAFRHMLPHALQCWAHSLFGDTGSTWNATGEFHTALSVIPASLMWSLEDRAYAATLKFARDCLDCFVRTPRAPLAWVPHWAGLCCTLPELVNWLAFPKAEASTEVLLYLSRICYRPSENHLLDPDYDGPEPWSRLVFICRGCRWHGPSIAQWGEVLSDHGYVRLLNNIQQQSPRSSLLYLVIDDMIERLNIFAQRKREVLLNLVKADPEEYWSDAF